jgi:anaerobic selenocysteine-containing dehydrogenase
MREAPPPAARPTAEFPLLLLSVSSEKSQASQWSRTPEAPLVVTVHPLSACGIADGALGRLESAIGSMTVRVRHDVQQRRDVALVPKGGSLRRGMCANALIRARLSDQGMGAALYDELVRLVPLTG